MWDEYGEVLAYPNRHASETMRTLEAAAFEVVRPKLERMGIRQID